MSEQVTASTEQPGFDYFECRECGFGRIELSTFTGRSTCPIGAEDCSHNVFMTRRTARNTDHPEGKDARKVQ